MRVVTVHQRLPLFEIARVFVRFDTAFSQLSIRVVERNHALDVFRMRP